MSLTKEQWLSKAADIFQTRNDLDRDCAVDAAESILSDLLVTEEIEFGDTNFDWSDPTEMVEEELKHWD